MNDPKTFYRELDSIIARIDTEKSDSNFFFTIISELKHKFGKTLSIDQIFIYEQRGEDFVLLKDGRDSKVLPINDHLNGEMKAVKSVLKHGSYIYDHPDLLNAFQFPPEMNNIVPAAIVIYSPEGNWLMVFGLQTGWIREEITLFLNALRTAFNYRLFSDMIRTEYERAEQIQRSLLPKERPEVAGYQIYGQSLAAERVGGDFYEYYQFDEDYFGAAIGDASGHGLPAALLVRDVVIGLRMGLTNEMRTVHTLKKLNQVIQRSTYSTNFVSLFIGEIENDGNLFYVNAGHPPPFLVSGKNITDLEATGITLGFLSEISLRRAYLKLESNSVLVMYTDGIIERENSGEEQFDVKRLKQLVVKNQSRSAREIVQLIYRTVFAFGEKTSWKDDATLVVIKKL